MTLEPVLNVVLGFGARIVDYPRSRTSLGALFSRPVPEEQASGRAGDARARNCTLHGASLGSVERTNFPPERVNRTQFLNLEPSTGLSETQKIPKVAMD